MSRTSLEQAIPPDAEILLDTSVILAYLNASETVSPAANVVVDEFVRSGRNRGTAPSASPRRSCAPLPRALQQPRSSRGSCSTSRT